jgi:hypothetical protein
MMREQEEATVLPSDFLTKTGVSHRAGLGFRSGHHRGTMAPKGNIPASADAGNPVGLGPARRMHPVIHMDGAKLPGIKAPGREKAHQVKKGERVPPT